MPIVTPAPVSMIPIIIVAVPLSAPIIAVPPAIISTSVPIMAIMTADNSCKLFISQLDCIRQGNSFYYRIRVINHFNFPFNCCFKLPYNVLIKGSSIAKYNPIYN